MFINYAVQANSARPFTVVARGQYRSSACETLGGQSGIGMLFLLSTLDFSVKGILPALRTNFIALILLAEGQTVEASVPSKKCTSEYREALDTKEI